MISIQKTSASLMNVVGGEMLLRFANVGFAVLIGRVYGPAALGFYAAVIASATLAERLADNGLELSAIAEVSKEPSQASRIATALYLNKTVLSLLAALILFLIAKVAHLSSASWAIAILLTLRTFLYSFSRLHAGFLKALDKTRVIVRIQFLHFLILLVGIFIVFVFHQRMTTLLLYLLLGQVFEFVTTAFSLQHFGIKPVKVSISLCRNLLHLSTPIGLTYTLSTIMLRGDVLVLSTIVSASALGTFVAADTGLVMVYVIAWLFSGVLLADLGKAASNQDLFNSYFRKCLVVISGIAFPLSLIAVFLVPSAIHILYGLNFAAAGLPGAIMAVAVPFIFLNAAYLSRAVAHGASKTCLIIYGIATVVSLSLNWILAVRYGATGVACSIVIREALMTLAFYNVQILPAPPKTFSASPEVNLGLPIPLRTTEFQANPAENGR